MLNHFLGQPEFRRVDVIPESGRHCLVYLGCSVETYLKRPRIVSPWPLDRVIRGYL